MEQPKIPSNRKPPSAKRPDFVLKLVVAGDPRIELGLPVPETGVLPLDQSPTVLKYNSSQAQLMMSRNYSIRR